MRGKLGHVRVHARVLGLIPAHAGKTGARILAPPAYQAHPRACGENEVEGRRRVVVIGSSPRMRGKLTGFYDIQPGDGLIPAHAGKTYISYA